GRNDDRPARLDLARLVDLALARAELDAGLPLLDPQELVVVGVDLAPDVRIGRDAHHGQLQVLAGERDRPERRIVDRLLLDVPDVAEHAVSFRRAFPETVPSSEGPAPQLVRPPDDERERREE